MHAPSPEPGRPAPGERMHAPMRAPAHASDPTTPNLVTGILDQTKALTATQRQELLDQLALDNQLTAKARQDVDLDMWATAVYEALTGAIGGEPESVYGLSLVKRLIGPTAIWRPIQEFMKVSKLCELTRVERQSVYGFLADLLVDHARVVAQRSGAPLGPKLVGSCTGNIAGVFDHAFPGYLRAGLARVVARQLTSARA